MSPEEKAHGLGRIAHSEDFPGEGAVDEIFELPAEAGPDAAGNVGLPER
jgi:hypothetical protein